MGKYAQLKRFHNYLQKQVYMYSFMYVESKTMPVEDQFLATKTFFDNYKKISTKGPVPKHWLGFSCIHPIGNELHHKFYDTENKQTTHPTVAHCTTTELENITSLI